MMFPRASLWRTARSAGRLSELLGVYLVQLPTIEAVQLFERASVEECVHRREWFGQVSLDNELFSRTGPIPQGYSLHHSSSAQQQEVRQSWKDVPGHPQTSPRASGPLLVDALKHNLRPGYTLFAAETTAERCRPALPLSSSLFPSPLAAQAPSCNKILEPTPTLDINQRKLSSFYSTAIPERSPFQEAFLTKVHSLNSHTCSLLSKRLRRDTTGLHIQHFTTGPKRTGTDPQKPTENGKPLGQEDKCTDPRTPKLDGAALSQGHTEEETSKPEANGGRGWSTWTKDEAFNLPNAISMARLISGPAIGGLIVAGHHKAALGALIVAGASDWLDGYVAKHYNIVSTLGTYLDPLADKVLMGSVAAALAYEGTLPVWLVSLVVARDVALIGAAALHRGRTLGWKWNGWGSYFQLGNAGAPKVRPLFISKANTVFQLALVGCALTHSAYGIPAQGGIGALCYLVGTTTVLSWLGYFVVYLRTPGRLVQ